MCFGEYQIEQFFLPLDDEVNAKQEILKSRSLDRSRTEKYDTVD